SAATVLAHYGSIAAIPDDHRRWEVQVRGAAVLAENLQQRRADAELYRLLATLRSDVPLEETLDQLQWRGPDTQQLQGLCREIGDSRALEQAQELARKKLPG